MRRRGAGREADFCQRSAVGLGRDVQRPRGG